MDRYELRRLEKAAREKDKKHLLEWATKFENQINESLRRQYNKHYQEELQDSIDNFITALAYTLHFNEDTQFNKDQLPGFMEDLFVTVEMFKTGEYKPEDYAEELKEAGIVIDVYDYTKIYRERLDKLDELIAEYDKRIKELDDNSFKNEI